MEPSQPSCPIHDRFSPDRRRSASRRITVYDAASDPSRRRVRKVSRVSIVGTSCNLLELDGTGGRLAECDCWYKSRRDFSYSVASPANVSRSGKHGCDRRTTRRSTRQNIWPLRPLRSPLEVRGTLLRDMAIESGGRRVGRVI